VCIWDREGFERKNFDSSIASLFRSLIQVMQDNYAERLGRVFILNPNWFFKMIWGVTSKFVSEKTRSKVVLINKHEELKK